MKTMSMHISPIVDILSRHDDDVDNDDADGDKDDEDDEDDKDDDDNADDDDDIGGCTQSHTTFWL